jgi:hypothetical protein
VTELVLLENAGTHLGIVGHGSVPLGHHYPLRTLLSHGGFSEAEARSAFNLHARGHEPPHALEALQTASEHMVQELGSVAGELFEHLPVRRVVVAAQEPAGDWFARSLAANSAMQELFPHAGEVRALRAKQLTPFVGVHARRPDLPLLLEVMFINTYTY